MAKTLYRRLANAEQINDLASNITQAYTSHIIELQEGLPGYEEPKVEIAEIDVSELTRRILSEYEGNPVFHDAMIGKISVYDSLQEIAEIRKGVKRFLPWKKDEVHNKRIKDIGELVKGPYNLRTEGIAYPDNPVTLTLEIAAVGYAAVGLSFLIPEMISPEMKVKFLTYLPPVIAGTFGPLLGLTNCMNRNYPLANDQARYIDDKIREYHL